MKAEQLRIFIGDKPVAVAEKVTIHISSGQDRDKEEYFTNENYGITGTMSIDYADKTWDKLYRLTHFTRKEKRKMMKLITSGSVIVIPCKVNNEPQQMIINLPRQLRKFYRETHSARVEWFDIKTYINKVL